MSTAPVPQFRSRSAPYSVINSLSYAQSALGGNYLPVAGGEISYTNFIRLYNNFALTAGIATMDNVEITVFDGVGAGSHTYIKSPVGQSWLRVYQTGYGESTVTPGAYTQYTGEDTAIGRAGLDYYNPEKGSDGSTTPQIRAGTNTNGVGFVELASYIETPDIVGFADYSFAIAVTYDWIP
jgi:hypothetical protein